MDKKKILNLILAIIIAFLGSFIVPNTLQKGLYSGEIYFTQNEKNFKFDFEFILDNNSMVEVVKNYNTEGINFEFIKKESYKLGIGEKISYKIKFDSEVSDIKSKIFRNDYEQIIPPTKKENGYEIFSMYIPFYSKIVMALLFFVAFLWLTEIIPLSAASLIIPIVAVIFKITDSKTILAPFFHPIIVLFFAGFLMAEAMKKTGVDKLIALTILKYSSLKPSYLMLTLMLLTAFLSMWMSNTASVTVIIPIVLAIVKRIQKHTKIKNFNKALVLGVAYAASIGGIGSAIGTPANILAFTFLNNFTDYNLGFLDWFYFGLPVVIIMIPLTWLYLIYSFKVRGKTLSVELDESIVKKGFKIGKINLRQKLVLGIFSLVMIFWLTGKIHKVPTAIVALTGAVSLFFLGILNEKDINKINWNALLTFGGGLAIGNLLVLTGVSDWIALKLTGLSVLPSIVVIFFVAALTLIIGAFISNTACAAMLVPVAIPLAQVLGIDVRLLVGVIAIGSSIDFALIVGTPPTMMAYSTGLFKAKEIFRRGIFLDILGIFVLSFVSIWVWKFLGIVI